VRITVHLADGTVIEVTNPPQQITLEYHRELWQIVEQDFPNQRFLIQYA
jgi:uncharacterized protein (UPF0218 family)